MTLPEEPTESPSTLARRHFHWCLAAVILPVVSLPFEWFVAYRHRRVRETTAAHRRWSRWLVGLAIVDTVVAALVIALFASGVWGWHLVTERRTQPRSGEAVRIGVTIVANPQRRDEAQIGKVATGSPAERAGLQPGDVLIAIDGHRVSKVEDGPNMIRSGAPGVPRTLRIRRAGEEAEIVVTPEIRPAIREPAEALFDAAPTPSCLVGSISYARTLVGWTGLWAAGFLIVVLWLVGRRAEPGAPALWSWVAAALGGAALAGPLAWLGVCISVGGSSVGGVLMALLAQPVVSLMVGLTALRHMAGMGLLGARLEPALGPRQAVLLGFFYSVAMQIRLSIFSTAVEAFWHVPAAASGGDGASGTASVGWLGTGLIALRVAAIGPIEEEVLFRGVILPRLVPWMGVAWAIVASSAVFAVLHEGFGNEPIGLRAATVFLIALVLSWARLRTSGLTAPITMHIVTNALWLWAHR